LNRRQTNLALLAILGLAAALRLTGLEVQSLWNDELSSWFRSHYASLADVIQLGVVPDVHPPGFQLLLYFVERTLGSSEWALRLPSALFGILTVAVMYLLGRRLYSESEGLVAAALTAVLWCPLYYSQEARPYSLLLLLSASSTYFWIGMLEEARRGGVPVWRSWVPYVVCASLALYAHYFGLLLVACQTLGSAAYALWLGGRWRRPVVAAVLIGVAYLPWMPQLWADLGGGPSWILSPSVSAPWTFLEFLFNRSSALAAFALALYASLAIGTFRGEASKARMWRTPGAFLAAWLCLPVALALLVSLLLNPVFTMRNLIICLPAAYLLMARALLRLPLSGPLMAGVAVAVPCLLLMHTVFTLEYYWRPTKQQFREATAFVAAHESESPGALLVGNAHNPAYLDYYLEKAGSSLRVDVPGGSGASIPRVEQALRERQPRYMWYIGAHVPPEPAFLAFLESHTRIVKAQRFIGADALLLELLSAVGEPR